MQVYWYLQVVLKPCGHSGMIFMKMGQCNLVNRIPQKEHAALPLQAFGSGINQKPIYHIEVDKSRINHQGTCPLPNHYILTSAAVEH
jgi:hypothetical protein